MLTGLAILLALLSVLCLVGGVFSFLEDKGPAGGVAVLISLTIAATTLYVIVSAFLMLF